MNALRARIAEWCLALYEWISPDAASVDDVHKAIHMLTGEDDKR